MQHDRMQWFPAALLNAVDSMHPGKMHPD